MNDTPENGERPKPSIDQLPRELGFVETAEVADLRQALVESMAASGENSRELAVAYLEAAELLVEEQEQAARNRARVGLNVARALTFRDAGRPGTYQEYLRDVIVDLENLVHAGLDEFADALAILQAEAIDSS